MEQIITRQEAKQQGLRHYFTGKTCSNGHIDIRFVSVGSCRSCQNAHGNKRNAILYKSDEAYREVKRAGARKSYAKHGTRWYSENKEKASAQNKAWREEHNETFKKYCVQWRRNNLDKLTKNTAAYRAAKLQATPPWLTEDQLIEIEWIYHVAAWLSKEVNGMIDVDHIIPLNGKGVSGLHVPWNLQILNRSQNSSKNNRI